MDSSFQSASFLVFVRTYFGFNPCFNGFFFSICRAGRLWRWFFSVSILVLMDSSFQSWSLEEIKGSPDSFNPCFNGFFFSIWMLRSIKGAVAVSILVLMDSSFQFCEGPTEKRCYIFVSILVLMDSSFQSEKTRCQRVIRKGFQSLF